MEFAGPDRAAVADMERFGAAAASQRDLAADPPDSRVPFMRMVGVDVVGAHPAIKDLIPLALEVGFEFALVHRKLPVLRVITPPPPAPAGCGRAYIRH